MGRFSPDAVTNEGLYYGWWEHDYQWSQGELVILRKNDSNGDLMQINVWCSTGTVGSHLHHPRQGKSQLFRRECHSMSDLRDVFANPRVHGYGGYHEREELDRRQQQSSQAKRQRTVGCPGCGKMHYTLGDTAQHFESGRCPSCPGQENARKAAYALARQREHDAGAQGMFTNGGPALLTFSGNGGQDWSAGYEDGGLNYSCPGCRKRFRTMGAMLNHIQAKPQCNQGGGHLALGFR